MACHMPWLQCSLKFHWRHNSMLPPEDAPEGLCNTRNRFSFPFFLSISGSLILTTSAFLLCCRTFLWMSVSCWFGVAGMVEPACSASPADSPGMLAWLRQIHHSGYSFSSCLFFWMHSSWQGQCWCLQCRVHSIRDSGNMNRPLCCALWYRDTISPEKLMASEAHVCPSHPTSLRTFNHWFANFILTCISKLTPFSHSL